MTEKDILYLMAALITTCILWVTGVLPTLIHWAQYIMSGGVW